MVQQLAPLPLPTRYSLADFAGSRYGPADFAGSREAPPPTSVTSAPEPPSPHEPETDVLPPPPDCILHRLLSLMPHLTSEPLQDLTTLLLLLLYEDRMKHSCSQHLLAVYDAMLGHVLHMGVSPHPLIQALDRMTIQVGAA